MSANRAAEQKVVALTRAGEAAAARARAELDEALAIRSAARLGASTREIAAATDRAHATVARIIKREPAG